MSGPKVHDLLRQASPWLPANAEPHNVQASWLLGGRHVPATLLCQPDQAEAERRHTVGLTAVLHLDWLDTLIMLPVGLPVPPGALSAARLREVKRMPAGCVDRTAEGLVRHLVPPVQVDLAVVTADQWKPGLVRAGRFAAYCPRVLVMPRQPANVQQAAIEADFWGIGLVINAAREPELVAPPQPFVRYRWTPAAWLFLEKVHKQITGRRTAAGEAA